MLSSFVLIIIMYGGYNGNSPAVSSQEFTTRDTCIAAANLVISKNRSYTSTRAICTKK